jgi:hypothetical protein
MTAYLIVFGVDLTDRFAAYSFPDRSTARTASLPAAGLVPSVPPNSVTGGGHAYLVETEEDIVRSPMVGQLVAFYNRIAPAGRQVRRFESRVVGVQRLLALLATQARLPVGAASPPTEKEQVMSSENGTGRRGRRPSLNDSDVITIVAAANPKRAGSSIHSKWERLVSGQTTVAQAHEIGFSNHDLVWDRDKGFLTIQPAP